MRAKAPGLPKRAQKYMVRLVGPAVKTFDITVKTEVRKKIEKLEKIWTHVYRGYVPPWS